MGMEGVIHKGQKKRLGAGRVSLNKRDSRTFQITNSIFIKMEMMMIFINTSLTAKKKKRIPKTSSHLIHSKDSGSDDV